MFETVPLHPSLGMTSWCPLSNSPEMLPANVRSRAPSFAQASDYSNNEETEEMLERMNTPTIDDIVDSEEG